MADWIHNYPGVAKLLQQEGDVLEGVRQDEVQPAAAPRPLWERLPHQAEQGCVVTPPQRVDVRVQSCDGNMMGLLGVSGSSMRRAPVPGS